MTKNIYLLMLLCCTSLQIAAQDKDTLVSIKLKNASLLPKKIAVISYSPGEAGNGTQVFSIMPGSLKELQFKTKTKIYIANSQQTDSVMSGKRIDKGKPFLVVKSIDNKKTFNL